MSKHKISKFIPGFFLGGLIGGIVMYLLTTDDGKKKLENIIDKITTLENRFKSKIPIKPTDRNHNSPNIKNNTTKSEQINISKKNSGSNDGFSDKIDNKKRFFKKAGRKLLS
jgi:gas vesicle protein